MERRRDTTRVIYDILSVARRGASKTRLVYETNLNFQLAEKYIRFLLARDYLRCELNGPRGAVYRLSDSGERLFDFLSKVETELFDLFPASRPLGSMLRDTRRVRLED